MPGATAIVRRHGVYVCYIYIYIYIYRHTHTQSHTHTYAPWPFATKYEIHDESQMRPWKWFWLWYIQWFGFTLGCGKNHDSDMLIPRLIGKAGFVPFFPPIFGRAHEAWLGRGISHIKSLSLVVDIRLGYKNSGKMDVGFLAQTVVAGSFSGSTT